MASSPSPPSRAIISCRACAVISSPSSAASTMPARSSSAPPRSRATRASAPCCSSAPPRSGAAYGRRLGGAVIVHLVDGTYSLFRLFYGRRRATQGVEEPYGAVIGVLHSLLEMIEEGATHLGVATDHVIESFRNALWPEYKTGEGIDPALFAQFHPLEDALTAMGVAVWPMTDLEADDALASAARIATQADRVQHVCIWPRDKD